MENKLLDPIPITEKHVQMFEDAELTAGQLGGLVRALLCYQYEGELPEDMDPVSMALWKLIRADLKREFGEGIR